MAASPEMTLGISDSSARAVTSGPGHHSFGYYDKSPWDISGRYLLALEAPFCDRSPRADDVATLGVLDLANQRRFQPFAETRAWNWQQGCMLQWLPGVDGLVIYNDRVGERFVSVVCDPLTGHVVRQLPLPIYAVSRDGAQGLTLNFSRLHHQRPGYGYAGIPDRWLDVPEPEDDGIWRMDLVTGDHRLIVSIAQLAATRRSPSHAGAIHRFNHLQFSPDDTLFVFLHRWRPAAATKASPLRRGLGAARGLRRLLTGDDEYGGLGLQERLGAAMGGLRRVLAPHYGAADPGSTRMAVARADGSNITIVADEGLVSHFDWRDPLHILAWARYQGVEGFFLFDVRSAQAVPVGAEAMPSDGHCSYSPDPQRRWILNDTAPDRHNYRHLYVFDTQSQRRTELGRFYSPPALSNDFRCDLHPRWRRDGKQVCIDSAHEGQRQLYLVDLPADH